MYLSSLNWSVCLFLCSSIYVFIHICAKTTSFQQTLLFKVSCCFTPLFIQIYMKNRTFPHSFFEDDLHKKPYGRRMHHKNWWIQVKMDGSKMNFTDFKGILHQKQFIYIYCWNIIMKWKHTDDQPGDLAQKFML